MTAKKITSWVAVAVMVIVMWAAMAYALQRRFDPLPCDHTPCHYSIP